MSYQLNTLAFCSKDKLVTETMSTHNVKTMLSKDLLTTMINLACATNHLFAWMGDPNM